MGPRRTGLLAVLVIASAFTIFAAAMLALAQTRQAQVLAARELGWREAVTGLIFGFERQFALFRGELGATLTQAPRAVDFQNLNLRYRILVSRVDLLKASPVLDKLRGVPEYPALMARMDRMLSTGDALMAAWPAPASEVRALLAEMDSLAPEVQAYTTAASSATTQVMEHPFGALSRQVSIIAGLAAVQLLLVALATSMLMSHQKQQAAARRELERLAEELGEAKQAAEAANGTKSRFLANMSHELRTPFQGVIGMLQLLEQDQPTPSQRDLIRTARESAHHLLTLLNDVLDISALESGKIALHEEALNMRRVCGEVHNLMRSEASARGLVLTANVDPAMPARVRGDATRIKQILLNLLNNAIKFTPSGEVVMEARCLQASEAMADLRFSVSDTGIGMDEDTLARLFKRFEMGDVTLSRRFGGAGLGLEISRTLARMMGGELTATSVPGKGSRFELTLRLPVVRAAAGSEQDSMFGTISTAPGLYVLVADDHPVNRKYLGMILESMGHEAMLCENGLQALDAVRSGASFDLVLMDVHMPVMDGLSATRAIRELGGRCASLPVLVLTADVLGSTRQRAQECGVTAFLTKPIQSDQLSQALDRASARYASTLDKKLPATGPAQPEPLGSTFGELGLHLPDGQLPRLVAMFFADASRTIADLDAALAGGNKLQIREAAHKLDGSVGLLGFKRIAAALDVIAALPLKGPSAAHEAARQRLGQAVEETRLATLGAGQAAASPPAQSYDKV